MISMVWSKQLEYRKKMKKVVDKMTQVS